MNKSKLLKQKKEDLINILMKVDEKEFINMRMEILNMLPKSKLTKLIMKDKKPTKTKKKISKELSKEELKKFESFNEKKLMRERKNNLINYVKYYKSNNFNSELLKKKKKEIIKIIIEKPIKELTIKEKINKNNYDKIILLKKLGICNDNIRYNIYPYINRKYNIQQKIRKELTKEYKIYINNIYDIINHYKTDNIKISKNNIKIYLNHITDYNNILKGKKIGKFTYNNYEALRRMIDGYLIKIKKTKEEHEKILLIRKIFFKKLRLMKKEINKINYSYTDNHQKINNKLYDLIDICEYHELYNIDYSGCLRNNIKDSLTIKRNKNIKKISL